MSERGSDVDGNEREGQGRHDGLSHRMKISRHLATYLVVEVPGGVGPAPTRGCAQHRLDPAANRCIVHLQGREERVIRRDRRSRKLAIERSNAQEDADGAQGLTWLTWSLDDRIVNEGRGWEVRRPT